MTRDGSSSRICGEERKMWPKNSEKCKLKKIFKLRCCAKKRREDAAPPPPPPPPETPDNMGHEVIDDLVLDEETGETPGTPSINSETGEPELNCTQPETRRPFKIPNAYTQLNDEGDKKCLKNVNEIGGPKKFIANSETSKTPLLLFLLPTIFFFFPIVAVPLSIIEVALHTWAHKKNKKLRDKDIFYQSPMHVFVSEFCAACRFEASKDKITKIQDMRNKRNRISFDGGIECVRNIV